MKKFKKLINVVGIILVVMVILFFILMIGQGEVKSLQINDVNIDSLSDGVYKGEYKGYRWSNTVYVTIESKEIKKVEITTEALKNSGVADTLIERAISNQTPKVDTVSGATVTSKAILKAIENALTK